MDPKNSTTKLLSEIEWHQELDQCLKHSVDLNMILSITKSRPLSSNLRATLWQLFLGVSNKGNQFLNFDEFYDLPEQNQIRADSHILVDKFKVEAEEKLSFESDLESIITLFCKSRSIKYSSRLGFTELLLPLLSINYNRWQIYNVFHAIATKYISRNLEDNKQPFHLFRLILLYHDPELCQFLDTKKISPDLYAYDWFSSLFSSHCDLKVIHNIWDIYFQHADQFLIYFFALVILINARDQIIVMKTENKSHIIAKTSSFPKALEAEDIEDFCSLALYYLSKTPQSFRHQYQSSLFSTQLETLTNVDEEKRIQQSLCLDVSVEELLQNISNKNNVQASIRFFLIDCRPAEQYNAGHLPTAFHLDADLMLQNQIEFATAVQSLLASKEQAIASNSSAAGEHLCFIGSGREEENQYAYMVLANFLQKNHLYVGFCSGGYKAIHDVFKNNLNEKLSRHNAKLCICCNENSEMIYENHQTHFINEKFVSEKFGRFSSIFKSTSAMVKDKMINYIKNEQNSTTKKHVSSTDKVGKRYRNMGSVFTIGDEEDDELNQVISSEDETKETVVIDSWIKKNVDPKSVYECHEIVNNATVAHPSLLCLNDNELVILRKIPDRQNSARLRNKRPLATILKITSKKKQPEFITIKYGFGDEQSETTVTGIDRLLIPKAGEATKDIKIRIMQIIDGMEDENSNYTALQDNISTNEKIAESNCLESENSVSDSLLCSSSSSNLPSDLMESDSFKQNLYNINAENNSVNESLLENKKNIGNEENMNCDKSLRLNENNIILVDQISSNFNDLNVDS